MKPEAAARRVLVIPDKFKGTLTAAEAAEAIARGWARGRPQDKVRALPLTDGGDGFGDCMSRVLGARRRWVQTVDAAHRPCRCPWWFEPKSHLALVESALCIGLAMLPQGRYHPFDLDTQGLAAVLLAASRAGARQCLIGIGGSATNDAGFGLARGLGWRFLASDAREITRWPELARLASVVSPAQRPLGSMRLLVATDVRNPLLGRQGATRVYGPQKGLRPADFVPTERCLRRLRLVFEGTTGRDAARSPGAGAAGGLGYGLLTFARARIQSGFEVYARHARLNAHLAWADWVVTGEGALDASSLMGKGVGEIARRARERGLPCFALAGRSEDATEVRRWFVEVCALTPDRVEPHTARQRPAACLRQLARDLAVNLHSGRP